MVNEKWKARESLTRCGGQPPKDLDRGGVGGCDDGDWSIGGNRTNRINKVFEFRAMTNEEFVHRFHPRFFIAECCHIGQTLQSFGNEGQSALCTRTRVIWR